MTKLYWRNVSLVRMGLLTSGFMLALMPLTTTATTTVCSDPDRERVLAHATIKLPTDNIDALEGRFAILARQIGMTTYGTTGSEHGRIDSKMLGLQSPRVSVSIRGRWRPGKRSVVVEAWRTCIDDSLEPWQSYWNGFVSGLRSAGYTVRTSDP